MRELPSPHPSSLGYVLVAPPEGGPWFQEKLAPHYPEISQGPGARPPHRVGAVCVPNEDNQASAKLEAALFWSVGPQVWEGAALTVQRVGFLNSHNGPCAQMAALAGPQSRQGRVHRLG